MEAKGFPIDARVTACIVIGATWGVFARAWGVPVLMFYSVAFGLGIAIGLVTIGISYIRGR